MSIVYFTLVAIVLYLVADWLLERAADTRADPDPWTVAGLAALTGRADLGAGSNIGHWSFSPS